nr:GNAT family N-acetyltransferase [Nakamurella aerolata]
MRGIETTKTFVAEVDGATVGMGNIDLRPDKPVIWKLYVLPEHHGVGAGHARRETPGAEGWPDAVWMVRKPTE